MSNSLEMQIDSGVALSDDEGSFSLPIIGAKNPSIPHLPLEFLSNLSGTFAATESGADAFNAGSGGVFPSVESVATSSDYTGTVITVALPSGIVSGNLLLVVIGNAGDRDHTWPAGWTQLADELNATFMSATVGYRIADGSEGASIDVTASNTVFCEAVAVRISGAAASAPLISLPVINATANATPDPDSVSASWGSKKNLFLAAVGGRTFAPSTTLVSPPSGYTVAGSKFSALANEGWAAIAYKKVVSASENPGVFTTSQTSRYVTWSIVVRPAQMGAAGLEATETGSDTFAATGSVTSSGRTGTLAALESGADTFASTGKVRVAGAFVATESGSDGFAASGDVFVKGSLAASESGADTFAATGDVFVRGSLAASESGSDTFAAPGDVFVKGSLAVTESGADTFAAPGDVFVRGALAVTESGADTFASTGKVRIAGALSASESGSDTFAASGNVRVSGALAAAESGSDTFAASGTVAFSGITGTLAAAESGSDTFAAPGKVLIRGSLSTTETGNDSFASTGKVRVSGSLTVTESGADSFAVTGKVRVAGALAASESGSDTFAASGAVRVSGALGATESGSDSLSATGTLRIAGSLVATEAGSDAFAASGAVRVSGAFAASESGNDTFAASGTVAFATITGALAASESESDTFAGSGRVRIVGAFAASETGSDAFAASGRVYVAGTLSATETGADTFAATGVVVTPAYGDLAAQETGGDTCSAVGAVGGSYQITPAQALLLRRLHQLHGLAQPLEVGPTTRQAGDLVQSVSESGGSVTIATTGGNDTFSGSVGLMIEELAALHGLTADLVVSTTERTAGPITQAIATAGNVVTVTRQ